MGYKEFLQLAGPNYTIGNGISYGTYILQRCGGAGRAGLRFSNRGNAEKYEPIVQSFSDSIVSWGDSYFAEAYTVMHDPRLSEAGKIEKLTPLQKRFSDQYFADVVKRARNLQDIFFKKVEAAYSLPDEITGGSDVVNALQAIEVRTYLLSLPVAERIHVCLTSADPRLLFALDTCPECIKLLPDGLKERAHSIRVRRKRGTLLVDLDDERIALERIVSMVCNIKSGAEFVPRPDLPAMPDSVYPRNEDGTLDNVDSVDAQINALIAEFAIAAQ